MSNNFEDCVNKITELMNQINNISQYPDKLLIFINQIREKIKKSLGINLSDPLPNELDKFLIEITNEVNKMNLLIIKLNNDLTNKSRWNNRITKKLDSMKNNRKKELSLLIVSAYNDLCLGNNSESNSNFGFSQKQNLNKCTTNNIIKNIKEVFSDKLTLEDIEFVIQETEKLLLDNIKKLSEQVSKLKTQINMVKNNSGELLNQQFMKK